MSLRPKILFCGHLASLRLTDRQRFESLGQLGCRMHAFDFAAFERRSGIERLFGRIRGDLFAAKAAGKFNRVFVEQVREARPEIVWIEKAVLLQPESMREARRIVPQAIFVSYHTDNPFGHRSSEIPLWRRFINCIPEYDAHFVFRPNEVNTYVTHGAKTVHLTRHQYYPALHTPRVTAEVAREYLHDVLFIGTAIDRRIRSIARLMAEKSIRLDVYGNQWNRHAIYYRHRDRFHSQIHENHYSSLIAGSKICLGYVSASNLDQYTGRSIEIPACGGFFLGERTETHERLYEEGKEAEFFGSHEECIDKIHYYLAHDERRTEIARAGHRRCTQSASCCMEVMIEALRQIMPDAARGPSAPSKSS
jgi:hypothetical protein